MDRNIHAGQRWSEQIEAELASARAVITLWSSSSVKSRFVMDEANRAADRGVIVPARIDEVEVPYGFGAFQTPDLSGWDGDGDSDEWTRIIESLRAVLESEGTPSVSGSSPRKTSAQNASSSTSGRPKRPQARGSAVSRRAVSQPKSTVPVSESVKRAKAKAESDHELPQSLGPASIDGSELEGLLAEIVNPDWLPPRRLEIGDRLDELGDPRPGVGVIEIDVLMERDASPARIEA